MTRLLIFKNSSMLSAALMLAVAGCMGKDSPERSAESLQPAIDRQALVQRHHPVLVAADRLSPLSLGNGEFAFTADVTGLQSFAGYYSREEAELPAPGPDDFLDHERLEGATPLVTQSQWGWHTFPNPEGYTMQDATSNYDTHGRPVPYVSAHHTPAAEWLRQNPHRINLARIGFEFRKEDGSLAVLEDLRQVRQELDLWTGTLSSRFQVEGHSFRVNTWVHPEHDQLAVRVESSPGSQDRWAIRIAFPYARGIHAGDPSDWSRPEDHETRVIHSESRKVLWRRIMDQDDYFVHLAWHGTGEVRNREDHDYLLTFSQNSEASEFTVAFFPDYPEMTSELPEVEVVRQASESWWHEFWSTGAAIDLSGSNDPRALELERRIVLSQYLMAIQCSGSMPPQETGLTYNSWFGKFHLEMHWWHGVHFALWNRLSMLENSLDWYAEIIEKARETARLQGYKGVRWPKMVSPDGRDSPSSVGVFLIWQQPHPIYYAELVHRQKPGPATLERFREIVFETADFMASYAVFDENKGYYVLGPPLIPAQEIFRPTETFNPGFELAYWKFGLETAQQWRLRLGLERDPDWDRVLSGLPELPQKEGLFVNTESAPETFTDPSQRRDHPTLLGSCGFLPCTYADKQTMQRTLRQVMDHWNWGHTWGWDYPLIAMTAARVGEPEIAIEALMMEVQRNTYLPNGHNYQDQRLTLYLPGNGGLLTAVAMMSAGWDGLISAGDHPPVHAPGFPQDGSWVVRWEGLLPMP